MKQFKLTAIMFLFMACEAKVGVTNGNGTEAGVGPEEAQLQSILIPRCRSICKVLSTCKSSCDCAVDSSGETTSSSGSSDVASGGAASDGTDYCTCSSGVGDFDECFSGCMGDLGSRFLNSGEACAAAGVDLLDCFGEITCDDFAQVENSPDFCGIKSTLELCPDPESNEPSNTTVGGPYYSPPEVGGAGGTTGSLVGVAGSAGVAVNVVSCSTHSAGGKVPSLTPTGPNEELCDNQFSDCTDGHEYRVFCGTDTDSQVKCYCVFDGKAQVVFENATLVESGTAPDGACFNVALLNQSCGWSLQAN